MIPYVKSETRSDKKIYVGKITFNGDFSAVLNMLNNKLIGKNELPLTLKQTRDLSCNYAISIKESGIAITASSSGTYPAFSTLLSLINSDDFGSYFFESEIQDFARYNYRGVYADDDKCFCGLDDVKRLLDLLFKLKFCVFRWRLTNVEKYESAEIEEVLQYAKDRGIRVIFGADKFPDGEVDGVIIARRPKIFGVKKALKIIDAGSVILSDHSDRSRTIRLSKRSYYRDTLISRVKRKENIIGLECSLDGVAKDYNHLAFIAETAWNEKRRLYESFIEECKVEV